MLLVSRSLTLAAAVLLSASCASSAEKERAAEVEAKLTCDAALAYADDSIGLEEAGSEMSFTELDDLRRPTLREAAKVAKVAGERFLDEVEDSIGRSRGQDFEVAEARLKNALSNLAAVCR